LKNIVLILLACSVIGCTTSPYTVKSVIDKQAGTQIDTVCTHKKYFIPWYAIVAFGVFTVNGKPECHDITRNIVNDAVKADNNIPMKL
jgi:hypothetical protein